MTRGFAGATPDTGGGTLGVSAGAGAGVTGSTTAEGCAPEQPSMNGNATAALARCCLPQIRRARPVLLL
ncbi:hypothetical protein WMF31_41400 [Sorangium sp. So ce1036]|uniref:hypothetical protein n=1 Tax=Sorangium sp. So ce1036 TaxID=3133328 RepID=UPI003F05498F